MSAVLFFWCTLKEKRCLRGSAAVVRLLVYLRVIAAFGPPSLAVHSKTRPVCHTEVHDKTPEMVVNLAWSDTQEEALKDGF